ncbi:MAG: holo-ACP synthase [Magnetococcales bacterium]|nr:holo-ACP synthase [Magnetococcales bacterium]
MIVGIGTDIVKLDRLARSVERFGDRFIKKILTIGEIRQCGAKSAFIPCLAKRFAAKEAFVKALGTGMTGGIWFTDIQIDHDAAGRPALTCFGEAQRRLTSLGPVAVHLSLSDEVEFAVAFVIIEKELELGST